MPRMYDLTGQRFGQLVALNRIELNGRPQGWLCRCDCGGHSRTRTSDLRQGKVRSCGCSRRRESGRGRHPLNRTWYSMIRRCTNPKDQGWQYYGGRGIRVCEEWVNSFEAFATHMGPRPPGLTLDRIDVNGNYEPGNCRWATLSEQEKNKRIGPHGLPGNPARGEKQGFSKLTEEKVRQIREQNAAGMTNRAVAELHGVSIPTVQDIVHRRTWRLLV